MTVQSSRRDFMVKTAGATAAVAMLGTLAACGGSSTSKADFKYGVASGDPLSDRVILWTHAKIVDSTNAVWLTWEVAADKTFATVLRTGRVQTTEASSFTAKVDVTGLTAGSS